MSTQVSLTIIAICQLLTIIALLAIGGGLIYAIIMLKRMVSEKTDEMMSRVQPIVDQTKEIAEQARETAEKVSEKVDSIMTKAESTASRVTERVDHVTAMVEESVSPQAASIAGYVAAGLKAFQLFKDISASRASSSSQKHGLSDDAGTHI